MPCPKVKSSESMTGESIGQETGKGGGAALLKSVIKDPASSSRTAPSCLLWTVGLISSAPIAISYRPETA